MARLLDLRRLYRRVPRDRARLERSLVVLQRFPARLLQRPPRHGIPPAADNGIRASATDVHAPVLRVLPGIEGEALHLQPDRPRRSIRRGEMVAHEERSMGTHAETTAT
jgi:hypothetical protein